MRATTCYFMAAALAATVMFSPAAHAQECYGFENLTPGAISANPVNHVVGGPFVFDAVWSFLNAAPPTSVAPFIVTTSWPSSAPSRALYTVGSNAVNLEITTAVYSGYALTIELDVGVGTGEDVIIEAFDANGAPIWDDVLATSSNHHVVITGEGPIAKVTLKSTYGELWIDNVCLDDQ